MTLPRPELSEKLGVSYRRIPILAIGNDVYCDSSLIASALERHFPPSEGYKSLFPPRKDGGKSDTGLVKLLCMYWTDRKLFPMSAESLPYAKFPAAFLKDRSSVREALMKPCSALPLIWLTFGLLSGWVLKLTPKFSRHDTLLLRVRLHHTSCVFLCTLPRTEHTKIFQQELIEEQLSDGREWLLDTEYPGLGDLSVHFILSWIRYFQNMKDLFEQNNFPNSVAVRILTIIFLD